jgi:hypothetical protein
VEADVIQEDDIVIRIRMAGDGAIDAKAMIEALDIAEGALYASDRNDVEQAARELRLPAYVRDASLERLRHHRHQRLLIEEAQTGSIILVTVVAAVSLFVLEKTVGEAFADGFKETRAYGELRDFFRRQIDAKTIFIAEALRRAFGGRKREVSVQVDAVPRLGPHVIQIETLTPAGQARSHVGSISEHLRRDH